MPYILKERRKKLDSKIEDIAKQLRKLGNEEGDLNYTITRLVLSYWNVEPRYKTICKITGVLENVKQEFYRRFGGPYEDLAIERNGDL